MHIETDRIVLRDFANSDLDDLYEILGDPIVMEHAGPPYDLDKDAGIMAMLYCGKIM